MSDILSKRYIALDNPVWQFSWTYCVCDSDCPGECESEYAEEYGRVRFEESASERAEEVRWALRGTPYANAPALYALKWSESCYRSEDTQVLGPLSLESLISELVEDAGYVDFVDVYWNGEVLSAGGEFIEHAVLLTESQHAVLENLDYEWCSDMARLGAEGSKILDIVLEMTDLQCAAASAVLFGRSYYLVTDDDRLEVLKEAADFVKGADAVTLETALQLWNGGSGSPLRDLITALAVLQ